MTELKDPEVTKAGISTRDQHKNRIWILDRVTPRLTQPPKPSVSRALT